MNITPRQNGNQLNPQYKYHIDRHVAKYNKSITAIYAGYTTLSLEQQYQLCSHKYDLTGATIEEIVSSTRASQIPQMKLAEAYLTQLLEKKYRYIFTQIHNTNAIVDLGADAHRVYIIYK